MSQADEMQALVQANDAFYAAFAAGDGEAMEALWATTAPVLCVHPGTPALHGHAAVMQSWQEILAHPPAITHSSPQVSLVRGLGFVTCLEHLEQGTLAASNIFVWEDARWKLVHHHSGALASLDPEAAAPSGRIH
jgi:ketosteroid isomerase-like protein